MPQYEDKQPCKEIGFQKVKSIIDCIFWALTVISIVILALNDITSERDNRNLAARLAAIEGRLERLEATVIWRAEK